MTVVVVLAIYGAGPPVSSGVFTLPLSWTAQAVYPDGSAHSATRQSFTADEVSRVTYVLGQV